MGTILTGTVAGGLAGIDTSAGAIAYPASIAPIADDDGGNSLGPLPIDPRNYIPQQYQIIWDVTATVVDILTGQWYDLLSDVINLVEDVISLLELAFQGKPNNLSTLQVAQRLMSQGNIAAGLWGMEMYRLVSGADIVLSDSTPSHQTIIGQQRVQFESNLALQGYSTSQISDIVQDVLFNTSSSGQPLLHGAGAALPTSYRLYGTQTLLAVFNWRVSYYEMKGWAPQRAARLASNWLFSEWFIRDLYYLQPSQQPPTSQPPWKQPPLIPLPADVCQGYINNLQSDQTQITALQAQVAQLQTQVQTLTQQLAQQNPPADCSECQAQLAAAQQTIASLQAQLATLNNSTLAQDVAQIAQLQGQLAAAETQITQLQQQLAAQPGPTNCQGYINQLATANQTIQNLQTQNASLQQTINQLNAQITQLQNTLNNLGGGSGAGSGNSGGDEFTAATGQIAQVLQGIITAIGQIQFPQPPAQPDTCCQNLVAAINATANAIAGAITNYVIPQVPPAQAVDLSALVAALNAINATLQAQEPSQPQDLSFLEKIVTPGDLPVSDTDALIEAMTADGTLDAPIAAAIIGSQ